MTAFEIVEVKGKGKIMISKVELLPGHIILRESPLLFIPKENIENYRQNSNLGEDLAQIMTG